MITIEVKDPLEPFDWDGGDILLTAEQVREAIEAMGEMEEWLIKNCTQIY